MSVGQIILSLFVTLFAGYFIYRVKALNNVQRKFGQLNTTAEGHNARVDEAIKVSVEQTVAMRENSELLRELIVVNRQILEKQDRPNS